MKYLVIGNIARDGKNLKQGSMVEFDDDEAAKLLRDGYLAQGVGKADKSAGKADDAKDAGK